MTDGFETVAEKGPPPMTANKPPENNGVQNPAGGAPPEQPQNPQPAAQAAPQTPPPAGYPPAPGAFAPQPPPPAKKGGVLKRILLTVGVAIVAIVVGILVRSGVFDSPSMKVGDCVQQTGTDSVKVVACDSADAQYKVLGIVEKQSQISARMGACKAFPETTSVYWEGRNNSSGTVYCLQEV
jgi:hypothetical protein